MFQLAGAYQAGLVRQDDGVYPVAELQLLGRSAWRGRLVAWWIPALMLVGTVATELVFAESTGFASAPGYLPVLVAQAIVARQMVRGPLFSRTSAPEPALT